QGRFRVVLGVESFDLDGDVPAVQTDIELPPHEETKASARVPPEVTGVRAEGLIRDVHLLRPHAPGQEWPNARSSAAEVVQEVETPGAEVEVEVRRTRNIEFGFGAQSLVGSLETPPVGEEVAESPAEKGGVFRVGSAVVVQPSVPDKCTELQLSLLAAREGGSRGNQQHRHESQNRSAHGYTPSCLTPGI